MIVTSNNKPFSTIKDNSPKMYNSLKELCEKYKKLFGEEYKVKRLILTPKGYKFI
jgi:hypothetical protein